jgi:hypothetical protein
MLGQGVHRGAVIGKDGAMVESLLVGENGRTKKNLFHNESYFKVTETEPGSSPKGATV